MLLENESNSEIDGSLPFGLGLKLEELFSFLVAIGMLISELDIDDSAFLYCSVSCFICVGLIGSTECFGVIGTGADSATLVSTGDGVVLVAKVGVPCDILYWNPERETNGLFSGVSDVLSI